MTEPAVLRIGELSRRTGVSEHVLRAWESRYGLLRPARSAGRYRLYTAADERRVRRMTELIAGGLSAAEAARAVLARDEAARADAARDAQSGGAPVTAEEIAADIAELRAALDVFDEPAAQAVLDRNLARLSIEVVLRELFLPYLSELGERWASGVVTISQEHFASNVLRARLATLAVGWGAGFGPRALLACPPGEQHDLPLLMFGIALHRLGWRITYLGGNTPLADLSSAVRATRPDLIVLAAVRRSRFADIADALRDLPGRRELALAGAGADAAIAARIGARLLSADPVSAATAVAAEH